ncbi:Pyridoxine/pyridoxamine 5'-phosphate oxidase [Phycisphaerae bacterium RAS1]|nr:Pyridoxine/pyridoxamine 5'-phosphate oxidase [Phycisphaerae bacterium RAS1]
MADHPIHGLRREFRHHRLLESEVPKDPLDLFRLWFDDAMRTSQPDPNALVLATADAAGRPSCRIVLLKGFDAHGFVFFTNYDSRKGVELAANPYASMCFWWGELERQVRVEGPVGRVSAAESDAYFRSRPRESQLGAAVSAQSRVIADRAVLENRLEQLTQRFEGMNVPRPVNWGGYRLCPEALEFWCGREHRLHDRLRYELDGANGWRMLRLAP